MLGLPSGMRHEIQTPASWQEPIAAYLGWLRGVRRADGTIYQHSYQLRRFATSTGLDPWPVTTTHLVEYLATLDDREVGASGRRTVRQVLRGFYSWGVITERWDTNPALRIPSIPAHRGVARPAPEHSVRVGLNTPDERTRAMILLAVKCGLRCREIAQVHTDDLIADFVGFSLVAHGKGDKQRLVPAPADVVHLIRSAAPGFLFAGKIDGHLSAARVSELISEALPPGVTAHMLRHRYGTRAYHLGGRDLRAVQTLLGHAYSTTTEIYVAVGDDAVRRAALAAAAG